jgi:hypothetical protein
MARETQTQKEINLVAEVKRRFDECDQGRDEAYNREQMRNDLMFCYVPGEQWEANTLARRRGRPNYSFNRTVQSVNQVVGDQRQARITGKVRAVNKDASKETADIYGGLIRNIEAVSGAQYIYSDQFKYAVAGGWGVWRICPDYIDDNSFDQELYIRGAANPLTWYFDPAAVCPCKSDASWVVGAERLNKDVYKAEYPSSELASIDVPRDNRDWVTDSEIRIAEYFKRTAKDKTIASLSDGRVIEYDAQVRKIEEALEEMAAGGMPVPTIERTRKTQRWMVTWWKVNGVEILEGPIEYRWKRIPVVRLPGRFVNVEGRQYVQSLIRHTKDAQRTYNYNRSTMVEAVALTPKAPYMVTPKMIQGYEQKWNSINANNYPYIEYLPDANSPTLKPTREPPPEVPQALISLAAADAEDIKQTTGQVNPGMPTDQMSADESGRALRTRLMAGGSNAYEFTDNLQRAVQITHEMLIDMAPSVYDTERVVRIVGEDEVEDYVKINGSDPNDPEAMVNDLSKGSYDVTVTIGPAYATARQEATETLMEAVGVLPIVGEIGADIIMKNLDIEDGDEIVKRIRKKYIAAGVIEPSEEEAAEMGPPPPPDPVQTAMVQRLEAQTARDAASAQKTQAEVEAIPLELEQKLADIVNARLDALIKAGEISAMGAERVSTERSKATDASLAT